ncbi:hypothetical protein EYC84_003369 [Monilinia fructicola]|uniref:Uncharacterized protein n=1 Tax=Monilinia fructicola TaxID=38448 RepID=A0A5M9JTE4_MONFR|nr:hypothetical protein EYC84_003369 [Monilinia fructicola]
MLVDTYLVGTYDMIEVGKEGIISPTNNDSKWFWHWLVRFTVVALSIDSSASPPTYIYTHTYTYTYTHIYTHPIPQQTLTTQCIRWICKVKVLESHNREHQKKIYGIFS